jgi:hypothetical protein
VSSREREPTLKKPTVSEMGCRVVSYYVDPALKVVVRPWSSPVASPRLAAHVAESSFPAREPPMSLADVRETHGSVALPLIEVAVRSILCGERRNLC